MLEKRKQLLRDRGLLIDTLAEVSAVNVEMTFIEHLLCGHC